MVPVADWSVNAEFWIARTKKNETILLPTITHNYKNPRSTLCFWVEGAVEGALALLEGVGGISSLFRIRFVRSENRFARCLRRPVTKSLAFGWGLLKGKVE